MYSHFSDLRDGMLKEFGVSVRGGLSSTPTESKRRKHYEESSGFVSRDYVSRFD